MNIVCCIKQVPDTQQVKIDPVTNTLIRAGVESICNPYDLVAVEAAVKLVEKHGGKVTVITMGPPQADVALRECLSIGAADVILLSDRAFAGADTLATSFTLASTVNKIGATEPVDLVICGKQAIDGDTAQTGPGMATRLGFNQFTYVSEIVKVDTKQKTITVRREIEGGSQIIEGKLPAVLTVELELGAPRYATLPEMVRSFMQEVKVWGANELNVPAEKLGLKGSPTSVKQIFAPAPRKGGQAFDTRDNKEAVKNFLDTIFKNEASLLSEVLKSESKG